MNVKQTVTAHFLSTVKAKSVETLVLTSYAELEHYVKLKHIELFANVPQVYKVIHWCPALKLDVHLALNALVMKNVII